LKRFRVARQLHFTDDLGIRDGDRRESTAPESDIDTPGCRVIPDVIGVVTEPNRRPLTEIIGIQQLHTFSLAIRDRDQAGVRHHGDALRLPKPGQTLQVSAGFHVQHFHRVVPESRDKQMLACRIEGEMIDSSLDPRQFNRTDQRERFLCRRIAYHHKHDAGHGPKAVHFAP
jgi:hypothetical protein